MRVIDGVAAMAEACSQASRPLGLVPTMGYLHRGHLALVQRARKDNATLAVSIFVNPTQFGPDENLEAYPQDKGRDLALMETEGTDLVFAPSVEEMYPKGMETWVEVDGIARRLEGEHRPGHFRGVATVVAKLLNIVRPDRAYFGQKDGQQLAVLSRMAADLNMGMEVVVVPTVREADGLALSSRNVYLSAEERRAAPVVHRALAGALKLWEAGERRGERLRAEVGRVLEQEPLVRAVDYVSVAHADTLKELEVVEGRAMVSMAVWIGRTRLIDNVVLGEVATRPAP
jgi:pantoate--beta-alanine ligase